MAEVPAHRPGGAASLDQVSQYSQYSPLIDQLMIILTRTKSSLVWTLDSRHTKAMLDMDTDTFITRLNSALTSDQVTMASHWSLILASHWSLILASHCFLILASHWSIHILLSQDHDNLVTAVTDKFSDLLKIVSPGSGDSLEPPPTVTGGQIRL